MSNHVGPEGNETSGAVLGRSIGRRTLIRALALGGGSLALGASLIGCSSDAAGAPSGSSSPGGTGGASTPPAGTGGTSGGASAPAGGTPTMGGKLTIGIASSLADFDPYNHLAVNFPMMATLYSYLITYDDDYQPHPDLATKWTIADDHLSATITLRDTVFHDGSPVTGQDVVAGITRALDPKLGLSEAATASIIKTATAPDEHTVKLEFTGPTAESRILDFMYWFPVVQASKNTPEQLKQTGAGSGPFMLDSYSPGDSLVLKKNPHYYDSPKPYLDELQFRFFDTKDALVSALRGGSVDGALAVDARYNNQLKDQYTVVQGAPGALITLFRLNPLQAPFDNKLVRQAVARSIDRERLIKEVQGGLGQPVYTSFPPNSAGFDAALLQKYGFDLDAAKALLEQSGGGKSAKVIVDSADQATTSALLIIKEDLAKIGFELTLDPMDATTVNAKYLEGSEQCVIRASSNAYSSPTGITQDSGFRLANNALWKDQIPQDYQDAIAALTAAATPEAVQAATAQLNTVLTDESWAIGMYTQVNLSAMDSKIKGFTRSPADHPVFTEVYVA